MLACVAHWRIVHERDHTRAPKSEVAPAGANLACDPQSIASRGALTACDPQKISDTVSVPGRVRRRAACAVGPDPVPDLRHVLAMLAHVTRMLDQSVAELLLDVGSRDAKAR